MQQNRACDSATPEETNVQYRHCINTQKGHAPPLPPSADIVTMTIRIVSKKQNKNTDISSLSLRMNSIVKNILTWDMGANSVPSRMWAIVG